MGIFRRREALEALQSPSEAMEKVRERLGEVERSLRMMQLEWADTLERLKSMMHRAIKERQNLERLRGEDSEEPATELEPQPALFLVHLRSREEGSRRTACPGPGHRVYRLGEDRRRNARHERNADSARRRDGDSTAPGVKRRGCCRSVGRRR